MSLYTSTCMYILFVEGMAQISAEHVDKITPHLHVDNITPHFSLVALPRFHPPKKEIAVYI